MEPYATIDRALLDLIEEIQTDPGVRRQYAEHPRGQGYVHLEAEVDPTAHVGNNTVVMAGAKIGRLTYLGTGCQVQTNAVIGAEVVIDQNTHVLEGAHVHDRAALGCEVIVGNGVVVGSGSIVANSSRLGNGVTVPSATFLRSAQGDEWDLSSYLEKVPVIPVVENIDSRIVEAVGLSTLHLDMNYFHSDCGTSHCRAGFAIHLGGPQGYALEEELQPWLAGALIYRDSRPGVLIPEFYDSTEEAWEDLEACARREQDAPA